jgi:hypothetical protein
MTYSAYCLANFLERMRKTAKPFCLFPERDSNKITHPFFCIGRYRVPVQTLGTVSQYSDQTLEERPRLFFQLTYDYVHTGTNTRQANTYLLY